MLKARYFTRIHLDSGEVTISGIEHGKMRLHAVTPMYFVVKEDGFNFWSAIGETSYARASYTLYEWEKKPEISGSPSSSYSQYISGWANPITSFDVKSKHSPQELANMMRLNVEKG